MPRIPRFAAYGLLSTALAGAVVGGALKTRPNFFAAAVSVGRSSGSLMVISNFCLFVAVCLGMGFKRVFFGELRPVEYEHMFERLWIFLTESLLALTIFRDDFSLPFALLYGVLVFLKCFHWITADRVDYIDQVPPPGPPLGFHVRVALVTTILTALDALFFLYSMESITLNGVSAMVLFASEFAILLSSVGGTWARYAVSVADLRRARGRADAPAWEEKSMYLFYIDLAVDFAKLLTYLVFFIVIFLNYGLPIHILRDVYMTLRSFISRGGDLMRYRRATRNMDTLYPDATAEELDRQGDKTCIICREEMVARDPAQPPQSSDGPNETPKKLQCGHIFHFHCLRSWLERQQICPTCRRDVLQTRDPLRPIPIVPRNPVPPPQPGAAPAPPADGTQIPPMTDEQHRTALEEYFRFPAPNGDAPVPLPQQQQPAGPSAPATSAPPAPDTPAPAEESEDARLQRGIWGAPVLPGRFWPQPLGAAPAPWPLGTSGPSRSAIPPSAPESGTTTPAASRSPVVFSHSRRAGSDEARLASAPVVTETMRDEIIDDDDDGPSAPHDERAIREAAAAAALRRLAPAGSAGPTAADKGKARAEPEPPKRSKAYLTPYAYPPPHLGLSTSLGGLGSRLSGLAGEGESEDPKTALDERLKALREVDSVVWGLVGELSRLKSAWEAEDERRGESEGEPGGESGEGEAVAESEGQPAPNPLDDEARSPAAW